METAALTVLVIAIAACIARHLYETHQFALFRHGFAENMSHELWPLYAEAVSLHEQISASSARDSMIGRTHFPAMLTWLKEMQELIVQLAAPSSIRCLGPPTLRVPPATSVLDFVDENTPCRIVELHSSTLMHMQAAYKIKEKAA